MKKTEEQDYVDFIVTARKYKTLLTEKYKNRPIWHKPLPGDITSNLPGTVMKLEVKVGQQVEAGQLLLIHQAMKMLNRVIAPMSGTILEVAVQEGEKIGKGHLMVRIDPTV